MLPELETQGSDWTDPTDKGRIVSVWGTAPLAEVVS
jgi:hypothetical protein